MWEFIRENTFIVGALSGSLAAYLLGLFVNYIRREKKIIGYSAISRKIVERGHKDLAIYYKDKEIYRLYSHQVIIRNVGNRALKDLPVKIKFSDIFLDLELSQPEGANFKMTTENNNEITVHCDLLERDENFKIGFTSIELVERDTGMSQVKPKITVVARAEGLQCKDLDSSAYPVTASDLLASLVYETIKDFATRMR